MASFTNLLLSFLLALRTVALPRAKDSLTSAVPKGNASDLLARQLLQYGSTTACCDNCPGRYDYDAYWLIFDDLCTWLGAGVELWTTQAYYTGDWYCGEHWDPLVCVRLQILYTCGGHAEAPVSDANPAGPAKMDYEGCMGYLEDSIQPADVCDGPPYPGARTETANGCWVLSVVADESSAATRSAVVENPTDALECAPEARLCPISTSANGTALAGALTDAVFGTFLKWR